MATLKDLLTPQEIEKCFGKYDLDYTNQNIEIYKVQDLQKICTLIMPLVFPNGVTDGNAYGLAKLPLLNKFQMFN